MDTEPSFSFRVFATDGAARQGEITMAHGVVRTPAFMPVGTQAAIKGVHLSAVRAGGADIVLANTYHLMLRPGAERIARLGGLHSFMRWKGPIITDSGGFQVMSLAELRKLDPDGVTFRSPVDGTSHRLTPERAIEIQHLLDADITMSFDECTTWPVEEPAAAYSMRLSMKWAERGRQSFLERKGYGLFGIVQGSVYLALREESAGALVKIGFDGYAIGGLAVGEGKDLMFATLDTTLPQLPADKPRYLMGVGRPADLVGAVRRGVDMFDCVMPTRNGRHGMAFTRYGQINLRNARHADDPRPLDEASDWPSTRNIPRAYLHHLVRSGETLGAMLLSEINIAYYQRLMLDIRAAIANVTFEEFRNQTRADWARGDIAPRT